MVKRYIRKRELAVYPDLDLCVSISTHFRTPVPIFGQYFPSEMQNNGLWSNLSGDLSILGQKTKFVHGILYDLIFRIYFPDM